MDNFKSIVNYKLDEYGHVKVKLAEVLNAKNISKNRLHTLTGIKNDTIDRYCKSKDIVRVDLDFIAKVCCVLDCKIEDLLEYQKPEE